MDNQKIKTPGISILNQKGGVSKTVSTLALSSVLSMPPYNLRVLMLDFDPQSNLSILCGINISELDLTIADLMLGTERNGKKVRVEDCTLKLNDNLWLLPSVLELSAVDSLMQSKIARELTLKKAIAPILSQVDCIFIDNQPSLSLLPINALACSTHVIVPCSTQYLSYRGLTLLEETLSLVKENLNEDLQFYGVIATLFDNTIHAKEILHLLGENYNLLGTVNKATVVNDAAYGSEVGSVVNFAPNSKPAIAYKQIAERIYHDLNLAEVKRIREEMEANNNGK